MDMIVQGLVEKFQQDRDLKHLKLDEAFESFAGYCVLSSFYENEFDPDRFRMGGGNDLGIDAWGVVVNGDLMRDVAEVRTAAEQARRLDVRLVIVQAKTSPKYESKVITDLGDNLSKIIANGELRYPASDDIDNLRACLKAIYENVPKLVGGLPRLHIRYVTTGQQIAKLVSEKLRSVEKSLTSSGLFDEVDFQCVGAQELRELYKRAVEAVPATFPMVKKIPLPKISGIGQSYLGVIPARTLVDSLLTDTGGSIRKSLFYENVRDFQEYNDVNREIRATLRDSERRERFAVLNNGITIVTRALTVVGDDMHIRDFQIVNGCQTCHVLFDEREKLTPGVHVKIHLIESQDEDVIGGIVAATNRQTAVSEDDLSARGEFHKHLEDFFEAQPSSRRLYYERRSKQYGSRPDVEKTRIITRGQLTRAYASMFLNEPAGIGHYRELINARGDDLFKRDHHALGYYVAAAASYRVDWLFRNRRIPSPLSPARYHLLAAIKAKLMGTGPLPISHRAIESACQGILDTIWNANESERLVIELLPALQAAIDTEASAGVPLGEMVRTQRFAERVRQEVLRKGRPRQPIAQ